jgi:NitT/TauT family transport system permease protein
MRADTAIRLCLLSAIFIILVVWEIAGSAMSLFTLKWGYPSDILDTVARWMISGYIWPHLFATLGITVAGMLLGLLIGITLAFTFYLTPSLDAVLTPVLAWLNSLPRILLVPVFIASFGIGMSARLAMVVVMTVFLFFFNVLTGLKSIDPRLILNARLLGAGTRQLMKHVYLPLVGAWLISVLRPALGFALIGAIISEYFGSTYGIGYVVDLAYGRNRFNEAVAGLLIILVAAGLLDTLTRKMEVRWFGVSTKSSSSGGG